jgi:hypothetical protein
LNELTAWFRHLQRVEDALQELPGAFLSGIADDGPVDPAPGSPLIGEQHLVGNLSGELISWVTITRVQPRPRGP